MCFFFRYAAFCAQWKQLTTLKPKILKSEPTKSILTLNEFLKTETTFTSLYSSDKVFNSYYQPGKRAFTLFQM